VAGIAHLSGGGHLEGPRVVGEGMAGSEADEAAAVGVVVTCVLRLAAHLKPAGNVTIEGDEDAVRLRALNYAEIVVYLVRAGISGAEAHPVIEIEPDRPVARVPVGEGLRVISLVRKGALRLHEGAEDPGEADRDTAGAVGRVIEVGCIKPAMALEKEMVLAPDGNVDGDIEAVPRDAGEVSPALLVPVRVIETCRRIAPVPEPPGGFPGKGVKRVDGEKPFIDPCLAAAQAQGTGSLRLVEERLLVSGVLPDEGLVDRQGAGETPVVGELLCLLLEEDRPLYALPDP